MPETIYTSISYFYALARGDLITILRSSFEFDIFTAAAAAAARATAPRSIREIKWIFDNHWPYDDVSRRKHNY